MSLDASRWAWRQMGLRPLHKLVLLSLADRADAEDCCFPSHEMLIKDTGMDAKTIWQALKGLTEIGLIADTGRRSGCNQRTVVWQLIGVESRHTNPSKNGMIPKTESFRFSAEIIPKTEGGSFRKRNVHIEPIKEPTKEPTNIVVDVRASQTDDKRPAGASAGGEGSHQGEPAQPVERKRKTTPKPRSAMTADWQPDPSLWDDLATLGIGRAFGESLLPEFRRYWGEERAQEERPGWNRTFLAHVQRNWKREQERPPGGTEVTPLRPAPSGHRYGGGGFRTFEQMRAENTQRAIDDFLSGDHVGVTIDA